MSHERAENVRFGLIVAVLLAVSLLAMDAEAMMSGPALCAQLEAQGWSWWHLLLLGCW